MIRYHKSNFTDGYRQDAMDLFHGRYIVSPMQKSPFNAPGLRWLVSPVSLITMAMVMSGFSAWALRSYDAAMPQLIRVPLVILPAITFLAAVYYNGTIFVRRPILVPPQVGITVKPVYDPKSSGGLFTRKVHQI